MQLKYYFLNKNSAPFYRHQFQHRDGVFPPRQRTRGLGPRPRQSWRRGQFWCNCARALTESLDLPWLELAKKHNECHGSASRWVAVTRDKKILHLKK
jgi:hypothetical protein